MIIRRKHESHASLLDAAPEFIRRQINPHAQRLQHISPATLRGDSTVSVFHHHRSRGRRHKHRGRRNIEQIQLVATSAAHIQSRPGQIKLTQAGINRVTQKFFHKRRNLRRALTLHRHGLQQARLALIGHRRVQKKIRRKPHFASGHLTPFLKLSNQRVHAHFRITRPAMSPEGIITSYHVMRPTPLHQSKNTKKYFPIFSWVSQQMSYPSRYTLVPYPIT